MVAPDFDRIEANLAPYKEMTRNHDYQIANLSSIKTDHEVRIRLIETQIVEDRGSRKAWMIMFMVVQVIIGVAVALYKS